MMYFIRANLDLQDFIWKVVREGDLNEPVA